MNLPWSAPGFGQGVYPGQAPFFIPDRVDPSLVASIVRQREQQQAQISQAVQSAIGGIGDYLKKRQDDDMANHIMNQLSSEQGAPPVPQTVDPAMQVRPATVAQGGADALHAYMKAQQLNAFVNANKPDTAMDDLDYNLKQQQLQDLQTSNAYNQHRNQYYGQHPELAPGQHAPTPGNSLLDQPVYIPELGRYVPLKEYQHVVDALKTHQGLGAPPKLTKEEQKTALIAGIDTTTQNAVKYFDPKTNQPVDYNTGQKDKSRYHASAVLPNGATVDYPIDQFEVAVNNARAFMAARQGLRNQVAQRPDKIAMALQARDDPDATQKEKEQAKAILAAAGVQ